MTYSAQASRYVARMRRRERLQLDASWFDVAAAFDAGMRFAVIDRAEALRQIQSVRTVRGEPRAPLQDSEAREQDEKRP